jgi:hypothetical protein
MASTLDCTNDSTFIIIHFKVNFILIDVRIIVTVPLYRETKSGYNEASAGIYSAAICLGILLIAAAVLKVRKSVQQPVIDDRLDLPKQETSV